MAIGEGPTVGSWYETEDGQVFQVVALDESEGAIEIQYMDGDVDEMELDVWENMNLEEVVSPENWRGSMDESTEEEI